MQRAVLKTRTIPTVPTPRETALFLLETHHEPLEAMKKWNEESDLTFVKYYSPTSD